VPESAGEGPDVEAVAEVMKGYIRVEMEGRFENEEGNGQKATARTDSGRK